MKGLNRIFNVLSCVIGGPLLWHLIMPKDACWLSGQQIGCGVLLAVLFVGGAVVTYIAVLEEEKESGLKSGAPMGKVQNHE